ncbi:hypothetical protein AKO1_012834 [Acrasis kona]|uniref:BTB domain-containing protein n=1 Tax=Acrasis kona TaxID=1008807 RepID=A0AAW2YUG2_9EUKA
MNRGNKRSAWDYSEHSENITKSARIDYEELSMPSNGDVPGVYRFINQLTVAECMQLLFERDDILDESFDLIKNDFNHRLLDLPTTEALSQDEDEDENEEEDLENEEEEDNDNDSSSSEDEYIEREVSYNFRRDKDSLEGFPDQCNLIEPVWRQGCDVFSEMVRVVVLGVCRLTIAAQDKNIESVEDLTALYKSIKEDDETFIVPQSEESEDQPVLIDTIQAANYLHVLKRMNLALRRVQQHVEPRVFALTWSHVIPRHILSSMIKYEPKFEEEMDIATLQMLGSDAGNIYHDFDQYSDEEELLGLDEEFNDNFKEFFDSNDVFDILGYDPTWDSEFSDEDEDDPDFSCVVLSRDAPNENECKLVAYSNFKQMDTHHFEYIPDEWTHEDNSYDTLIDYSGTWLNSMKDVCSVGRHHLKVRKEELENMYKYQYDEDYNKNVVGTKECINDFSSVTEWLRSDLVRVMRKAGVFEMSQDAISYCFYRLRNYIHDVISNLEGTSVNVEDIKRSLQELNRHKRVKAYGLGESSLQDKSISTLEDMQELGDESFDEQDIVHDDVAFVPESTYVLDMMKLVDVMQGHDFSPNSDQIAMHVSDNVTILIFKPLFIVCFPSLPVRSSRVIAQPMNNADDILDHIESYLEENQQEDIFHQDQGTYSIIVEGASYNVHKKILSCRCEFFKTLFSSGFDDSVSNEFVCDQDWNSLSVKSCIEYMYRDVVSGLDEMTASEVQSLLERSKFVMLERLTSICRLKLIQCISSDTIQSILEFTVAHNDLVIFHGIENAVFVDHSYLQELDEISKLYFEKLIIVETTIDNIMSKATYIASCLEQCTMEEIFLDRIKNHREHLQIFFEEYYYEFEGNHKELYNLLHNRSQDIFLLKL